MFLFVIGSVQHVAYDDFEQYILNRMLKVSFILS